MTTTNSNSAALTEFTCEHCGEQFGAIKERVGFPLCPHDFYSGHIFGRCPTCRPVASAAASEGRRDEMHEFDPPLFTTSHRNCCAVIRRSNGVRETCKEPRSAPIHKGLRCSCWFNKHKELIYVEDACPVHGKE